MLILKVIATKVATSQKVHEYEGGAGLVAVEEREEKHHW